MIKKKQWKFSILFINSLNTETEKENMFFVQWENILRSLIIIALKKQQERNTRKWLRLMFLCIFWHVIRTVAVGDRKSTTNRNYERTREKCANENRKMTFHIFAKRNLSVRGLCLRQTMTFAYIQYAQLWRLSSVVMTATSFTLTSSIDLLASNIRHFVTVISFVLIIDE